jgi:hypothetical protein
MASTLESNSRARKTPSHYTPKRIACARKRESPYLYAMLESTR